MKPILISILSFTILLSFSCKKTYDCNCSETINNVPAEDFTYSGEGSSPLEVCNGMDDEFTTGTDTVVIDCEPK